MSDPYVGEIRLFAGSFAPRGWAFCDGQLLPVSSYDALFSLLGTSYGGDGRTTFALPDLRGRVPIHMGQGPGLSMRSIGGRGGAEAVTLSAAELPAHRHGMYASSAAANSNEPAGQVLAAGVDTNLYADAVPDATLAASAVSDTGGSQAHANLMSYTCIHFIIALNGIYPSRS